MGRERERKETNRGGVCGLGDDRRRNFFFFLFFFFFERERERGAPESRQRRVFLETKACAFFAPLPFLFLEGKRRREEKMRIITREKREEERERESERARERVGVVSGEEEKRKRELSNNFFLSWRGRRARESCRKSHSRLFLSFLCFSTSATTRSSFPFLFELSFPKNNKRGSRSRWSTTKKKKTLLLFFFF